MLALGRPGSLWMNQPCDKSYHPGAYGIKDYTAKCWQDHVALTGPGASKGGVHAPNGTDWGGRVWGGVWGRRELWVITYHLSRVTRNWGKLKSCLQPFKGRYCESIDLLFSPWPQIRANLRTGRGRRETAKEWCLACHRHVRNICWMEEWNDEWALGVWVLEWETP